MIIVAGRIVVPVGAFERVVPHMEPVLRETRREPGCRTYTFARDVLEPDVIRVFEIWESREALAAHGTSAHIRQWRDALKEIGVASRDIRSWEADEGQPL